MYDDLIRRLRETESRSKRALLDEAAQAIEKLEGQLGVAGKKDVRANGAPVVRCSKCGEPVEYSSFFGGYMCPCGCLTRLEPLQEVR